MKQRDNIFNSHIKKQFEFDEQTASVFDDMISRSVPFYRESVNLTINFALKYIKNNSTVYDLGCSTASTLINLSKNCNYNLNLIGIDSSDAMIKRAKSNAIAYKTNIDFICDDFFNISFVSSDIIISNYTLQFVRPLKREKLIKNIYNALNVGCAFIFSEKIIFDNNILNKQCIDEYYKFKMKKGYNEFEISQKREALENILIPYSENENIQMIKNAGFKSCETIFKWVNFATFIAIK